MRTARQSALGRADSSHTRSTSASHMSAATLGKGAASPATRARSYRAAAYMRVLSTAAHHSATDLCAAIKTSLRRYVDQQAVLRVALMCACLVYGTHRQTPAKAAWPGAKLGNAHSTTCCCHASCQAVAAHGAAGWKTGMSTTLQTYQKPADSQSRSTPTWYTACVAQACRGQASSQATHSSTRRMASSRLSRARPACHNQQMSTRTPYKSQHMGMVHSMRGAPAAARHPPRP